MGTVGARQTMRTMQLRSGAGGLHRWAGTNRPRARLRGNATLDRIDPAGPSRRHPRTGAATAVFNVVGLVLFRPLPYRHKRRPVSDRTLAPFCTSTFMFASGADWRHRRAPDEMAPAFQPGVSACRYTRPRVTESSGSALGTGAAGGAAVLAQGGRPNRPLLVAASRLLWIRRRAGDRAVSGTAIGVAPPEFEILALPPGRPRISYGRSIGQASGLAGVYCERSETTNQTLVVEALASIYAVSPTGYRAIRRRAVNSVRMSLGGKDLLAPAFLW
jgi:hypothetical protein